MIVSGTLRVPGDKSISHRSLILGALSDGACRVQHILESEDVQSTAGVLRALGADVPALSSDLTIHGAGLGGLRAPAEKLDCGNSGTTTRLMAGVIAALPITATFIGDASLSRRPMRRVARPLEAMGARVDLPGHGGLPMTIHGGRLRDITWESDVASAQVKSAVLLAALVGNVRAAVTEPARSRDHTERMLAARGAAVAVHGTRVEIAAGSRLRASDVVVPGDPSSAAFFIALAALATSGSVVLEGVCINETRTGFFRQLRRMGARIDEQSRRTSGGDPATGETLITGASELRVKESDRIAAVVRNLRQVGATAEELPDGMRICGPSGPLRGRVVTHGDHRMAMAFGIIGAAPGNEIELDDRDCVAVSYPGFWRDLQRVQSR